MNEPWPHLYVFKSLRFHVGESEAKYFSPHQCFRGVLTFQHKVGHGIENNTNLCMIPILLLKLARELYKAMSSWRHWTKLINSKENIIRLYTILRLEQIKSVNLFVIVFNSLHFHLSALKRSVLKYAGRNNFEETIWAMAWYFTLGKLKIPPKLSLIFFPPFFHLTVMAPSAAFF